MERKQLTRLIVLAVIIIGIIVGAVMFLGRTEYATLFSGMSPEETGQIREVLVSQGVDVRQKGTDALEVPAGMVDQLIVTLASQGYPKTGLAYDMFIDKASAFGTTDFEKREIQIFQRQENLRSTLRTLAEVKDAVVMISPGNRSGIVMSSDQYPPTATVVLDLSVDKLTKPKAKLVADIVAHGYPGLAPEDVMVTDTNLNTYDQANESSLENAASEETLRQSAQTRLQDQLKSLLALVFGEGKVGVMVNVKLDFDRAVSESQVFSPPVEGSEEGIVISLKELSETINGGTANGGVVGQDANGTASYPQINTNSDQVYNKATREANMEINSTKTQIEKAQGQISDLSVAVLLDSSDENMQDYTEQVTNIVTQALGINRDKVSVQRMPFSGVNQAADTIQTYNDIMAAMQQSSLIRTLITAGAVIVVALLIMMMLRTMFKKPKPEAGFAQLAGGSGQIVDVDTGEMLEFSDEGEESEMPGISASGKSPSREQIENFIERDPESAAQLLRNWLSDA